MPGCKLILIPDANSAVGLQSPFLAHLTGTRHQCLVAFESVIEDLVGDALSSAPLLLALV